METRRGESSQAVTSRQCADCGALVTTTWHQYTFRYGAGADAADLKVRLPVRRCDHCDFDYLDDEGERIKHEAVCRHLGVLTPAEIRGIRKRHGLSRSAFAKITGIGKASLDRWENGVKIQTPANDRYLRLLDHPQRLAVLRALLQNDAVGRPYDTSVQRFRKIEITQVVLERQRNFRLAA